MKKYESEENAHENFTVTVDVPESVEEALPSGTYVTNCTVCSPFTCHENCRIAEDEDKAGCWAMEPQGKRVFYHYYYF